MKAVQFAYWLQGFLEIRAAGGDFQGGINAQQVETIRNHLNLVFLHDIDPAANAAAPHVPPSHSQQVHDHGHVVSPLLDGQPFPALPSMGTPLPGEGTQIISKAVPPAGVVYRC